MPDAATLSRVEAAFCTAMRQLFVPLPAGVAAPPVAVAVSGGADSLALTLLLQEWSIRHGAALVALTVDHGLRPESADEAAYVASLLARRGVAHQMLTPPHSSAISNLQENARVRRYDALAEWCRSHGVLHCLLAHHAGDQRETVALMRARGATPDGESGMSAVRIHGGVRFVRPLLGLEKAELSAYVAAQGIMPVEDPSNQNPRFARVRARATLADAPAERAALHAALCAGQAERSRREREIAALAMRLVRIDPLGFATLALAEWRALPAPLHTQLLADVLTMVSGAARRPRQHETARLAAHLAAGGPRATLHGCEAVPLGDHLRIAREASRCEGPVPLCGHGALLWDGRFRVRHRLAEGVTLTLRALGMDGKKALGAAGARLPLSTPSFWHLDALVLVPYISSAAFADGAQVPVMLGFTPRKALAPLGVWGIE